MANVKIEPLGNHHDREGFDCEVEARNHDFKNTALQHHKRYISKTHVLTFKEGAGPIIAYATLSVCDVDFSQERETPILKKLPNTAPAIRLCRLAVDKKHKRQILPCLYVGKPFGKLTHGHKLYNRPYGG